MRTKQRKKKTNIAFVPVCVIIAMFLLAVKLYPFCLSDSDKSSSAEEKGTTTGKTTEFFYEAPAPDTSSTSGPDLENADGVPNNISSLFFVNSPDNICGFYSGKETTQNGSVEIDYKDTTVLLDEDETLPISDVKILPVGVISQQGKSACGAACLFMLADQISKNSEFENYSDLLEFAENNGYNNQGSLYSAYGGMDSETLCRLASDAFSINLVNKFDRYVLPSETIKKLLDNNKQAIVLVQSSNRTIVESGGFPHFILINGYEETTSGLVFFYADSNYYENDPVSGSLKYISSSVLDSSATSSFDEPNAILCIE